MSHSAKLDKLERNLEKELRHPELHNKNNKNNNNNSERNDAGSNEDDPTGVSPVPTRSPSDALIDLDGGAGAISSFHPELEADLRAANALVDDAVSKFQVGFFSLLRGLLHPGVSLACLPLTATSLTSFIPAPSVTDSKSADRLSEILVPRVSLWNDRRSSLTCSGPVIRCSPRPLPSPNKRLSTRSLFPSVSESCGVT